MDDNGWFWIIVISIVVAIIFVVVVVPFVITFWPWLLAGVAVIGIACGAFAYHSGKKQPEQQRIAAEHQRKKYEQDRIEAEKQREDKRMKNEQDRIEAEIQRDKEILYAEQQLARFSKWLTPVMVIDSNIWMNERYKFFFDCMELSCDLKKYRIKLLSVQYDEIRNIKEAALHGDPKSAKARIAISRIRAFQKVNLLNVPGISIDAKKGADAGPEIVKFLAEQLGEGKSCTFFSDDKELRVRVHEKLREISEDNWEIVEIQDHLGTFEKIVKGFQLRAEKAKAGLSDNF